MIRITVAPAADAGWTVRIHRAEPLAFVSGAAAEAYARRVAGALAAEGREAEVEITLRDGALAGRFHYGRRGWSAELYPSAPGPCASDQASIRAAASASQAQPVAARSIAAQQSSGWPSQASSMRKDSSSPIWA